MENSLTLMSGYPGLLQSRDSQPGVYTFQTDDQCDQLRMYSGFLPDVCSERLHIPVILTTDKQRWTDGGLQIQQTIRAGAFNGNNGPALKKIFV